MHTPTLLQPFDQGHARALALLRQGSVIAFPTDTVYGVGACGDDPRAVAQLFAVKDRPRSQAIPLLLADPADLPAVAVSIPPLALRLAQRYWPGGLTLVVPAHPRLPSELLAGGTTVAVRVPAHSPLRQLIRELGRPLAATSANLHGAPNPATAQAVLAQLDGRLPLILDDGPTPGDLPSTIVDVTGSAPRILRQGALVVEL